MPHKNREDYLEYHRNYDKTRKKGRKREYLLKYKYGLSLERFNELLYQQQGLCAICGNPETTVDPQSGNLRQLSVDHCHTTGKVRGLLCGNCNQGLGHFRDNPEYLAKAISYIFNGEK